VGVNVELGLPKLIWSVRSVTFSHQDFEWHRLVGARSADPAPEAVADLWELTFAGLDQGGLHS
jgi:hypothetical protein